MLQKMNFDIEDGENSPVILPVGRVYRQRNCIERMPGHLKINHAIATRYEQLTDSFLGMLSIASARYWADLSTRPSSALERCSRAFPTKGEQQYR